MEMQCFMSRLLLDGDLVGAVQLGDAHVHALIATGRDVLADEIGADRQLAVAAVDEHGQADAPRRPRSKSASMAARVVRPV